MTLREIITAMQHELNFLGAVPLLREDGIFGPKTEVALKAQLYPKSGVPQPPAPDQPGEFTRAKLAVAAEALGNEHVQEGSFRHREIIKAFAEKPANFGYGKWSWCSATVHYLCNLVGLNMPVMCPSKFGYSFALVEAVQQWAIEKGFYFDNDGKFQPEPGDFQLYDWSQKDIDQKDTDWENHIGVFLRMVGKNYMAAEGNTSNQTAIRTRLPVNVQGWVRIPDGYRF